ncbi:MAG: hypothetical protein CSB47_09355 [Proteobacteria bacterium]|nr:MAG: hypothetical protein CSB47_09355 [Pseudomonadota bacterium]
MKVRPASEFLLGGFVIYSYMDAYYNLGWVDQHIGDLVLICNSLRCFILLQSTLQNKLGERVEL